MRSAISVQLIRRLWLASLAYLLLLAIGLNTFFANPDFPGWIELLCKVTVSLAFSMIVGLPLLYVVTHFKRKKTSKALVVAGYVLVVGYAWLLGWLVYVKLKTCDAEAIPRDTNWYCSVEGKHAVFYFVAIPVVAAICGVVAGIVMSLAASKNRKP